MRKVQSDLLVVMESKVQWVFQGLLDHQEDLERTETRPVIEVSCPTVNMITS